MSDWISVDDRVPVVSSGEMRSAPVMVQCADGTEYKSVYSRVVGFNDYFVTHWRPVEVDIDD